jgi:hypothetical protein
MFFRPSIEVTTMKISYLLVLVAALVLSSSPAGAAGLVEKANLEDLIRIEYHEDGPGKVSGIILNQGTTELEEIVLLVRHHWVWPYAGNDEPDTYSRTEYVSVEQELEPGMAAAFASVVSPPAEVPDEAKYTSKVEVNAATEMVYCCDEPAPR